MVIENKRNRSTVLASAKKAKKYVQVGLVLASSGLSFVTL